jgi:hypothetical protein
VKHLLYATVCAAALLGAPSAFAATMQCAPFQTIQGATTASYTADADGIVTSVAANDTTSLSQAGCDQIGGVGYTLIGRIVGANMNVATDQPATMFIPANAYYVPAEMVLKNCSVSLTTAQGAFYDAASKGGNILFGSGTTQGFTFCTGAGTVHALAVSTAGSKLVEAQTAPPILSLTTIQGAAATANVYFWGYVLGK